MQTRTHDPSVDPARTHAAARARRAGLFVAVALALVSAACAAGARDPEVTRPRPAESLPYPVLLPASDERRAQAAANWLALTQPQAASQTQAATQAQAATQPVAPSATQPAPSPVAPPAPSSNAPSSNAPSPVAAAAAQIELHPVTATVRALPATVPASLRLPLVELGEDAGADADEATRESLRRFIVSARDLLGVDPVHLSLVELRDEAGGTRLARYAQKPFPRPLRNGFGQIEIRFAPDRRVLALTSTALPDTERIWNAVSALRPNVIPSANLPARLAGRTFTYTAQGATQTHTLAAGDALDVREPVIFPVRRPGDETALDVRLAWEIVVGRAGQNLLVHIDAITGETLSAEPTSETPRPAPSPTPLQSPAAPSPTPAAPTPTQTIPAAPPPTPTPVAPSPTPPRATPTPPAAVVSGRANFP